MRKIKTRQGRPPLGARSMTDAETQSRYRMKKKAMATGKEVEAMDNYNVFGPELEAKEFVDLLVKYDGNIVKAMRNWSSTLKSKSIADVYEIGMRMLDRKRIKELLRLKLNTMGVSADKVINDIFEISQKEEAQDKDKLRALELLGKFVKVFDFGEGGGDNYTLNISEDAAKRLLERRSECNVIDVTEESSRL